MKSFLGVKISSEVMIEDGPYSGKKVITFSDRNGNDWYEVRKDWEAVVMVDPITNIICAVERDVEFLTIAPDMNLYEVKEANIPDDMVLGNYKYIDGVFTTIT
ncbi:hypothetical protein [Enterobacter asburiae]|uniref:hypothetical protein n=1 Tax=Enterobacter asburiae TaxID=61645 RepID=UPI001C17D03C|nr:hypothetical protein [Enterobacter hormaechei subsp. xiangfangensis]HBM7602355.1 hypothetical protein [Enterobacter asburiae]HBM2810289.1 hypothetical protein [Enterobacter hormaechei subsp. xiangfangensis]HBM7634857.1 hypothetical protein [Enterobacter asburiae]HBM7663138.1 hypothetical protein [Enterobacter asburiae]